MKDKKRSKRRRKVLLAGGTVTVATLGLSNCDHGTAVDPLPPPPLICSKANQGQNLTGQASMVDSLLTITLYSGSYYPGVDTAYVSDVVGATLDSLEVEADAFQLTFTLDTAATTEVQFTLAGTWRLEAGPCDFSRRFTVTITDGTVKIAQAPRELPLLPERGLRIELVERDGRRARLRPSGPARERAVWSVTAGAFETRDDGDILWELPAEPGFYQAELLVDRGDEGYDFDALTLRVV